MTPPSRILPVSRRLLAARCFPSGCEMVAGASPCTAHSVRNCSPLASRRLLAARRFPSGCETVAGRQSLLGAPAAGVQRAHIWTPSGSQTSLCARNAACSQLDAFWKPDTLFQSATWPRGTNPPPRRARGRMQLTRIRTPSGSQTPSFTSGRLLGAAPSRPPSRTERRSLFGARRLLEARELLPGRFPASPNSICILAAPSRRLLDSRHDHDASKTHADC